MSAYAAQDELASRRAPITPDVFRAVFRDHAARVVVVTAPGEPAPSGDPGRGPRPRRPLPDSVNDVDRVQDHKSR